MYECLFFSCQFFPLIVMFLLPNGPTVSVCRTKDTGGQRSVVCTAFIKGLIKGRWGEKTSRCLKVAALCDAQQIRLRLPALVFPYWHMADLQLIASPLLFSVGVLKLCTMEAIFFFSRSPKSFMTHIRWLHVPTCGHTHKHFLKRAQTSRHADSLFLCCTSAY